MLRRLRSTIGPATENLPKKEPRFCYRKTPRESRCDRVLESRRQFGRPNQDGQFRWANQRNGKTLSLLPNLSAQPRRTEGMRTEDRRRDDPYACGYAPPGGEAFCGLFPAIVPRRFLPGASLSNPQRRQYRLAELCRSR